MPQPVANSDVVALELEKVLPTIRILYETDDFFYSNIKKRDVEQISNRQMRIPLEIAPGGAFQYFDADGGDLGRGGGPVWDKAVVQCIFVSENIEYTKLAEWGTNSSRKAVTQAVRRLVARSMLELRRQLDAQLQQNGTGSIGTISNVSTSGGVDTYTCNSDGFGVRLMRQGQTVQVFDAALATNKGAAEIITWNVVSKQISVASIPGVIATDIIVANGISTPTALPAIYGVPYHDSDASTGTWLGFDRSTTPQIRASRVDGGGNPLSLPLPRLAINNIGNRVGLDNSFNPVAWMHPCQKQAYEAIGQLVTTIFKKPTDESLNMYFDKMQMAGAPVREHFNWNQKRIDFISGEVWGRAEILPLGFYRSDDRTIFEIRGASGGVATADIFYMVNGLQTYANNPAACSYIDNLQVPAGY